MKIIKKIGLLMILFLLLSCNYCLADLIPLHKEEPKTSNSLLRAAPEEKNTTTSSEEEEENDSNFISYIFLGVAFGAVAITIIVLALKNPKGKIETNNEEKEKLNENKEE